MASWPRGGGFVRLPDLEAWVLTEKFRRCDLDRHNQAERLRRYALPHRNLRSRIPRHI